jgi:tetratricopeptide (TPR) repeat protein
MCTFTKKPLFMGGFLSLLILLLPAVGSALTPSQVFEKVKGAVVVVMAQDGKGAAVSQGSGVLLPIGKIATNCHVLERGEKYQVGAKDQFFSAVLYAANAEKDLCLLEADGLTAPVAELGQASGLKVGDAVYAVGSPKGLALSLSNGIVSQLRGAAPPLIQTTSAISPGSSGGGLFDSAGRLVGITTFSVKGGQSLNFALPVEWLADVKTETPLATQGRRTSEWLVRAIALEEQEDWPGLLEWALQWTRAEPDSAAAWAALGGGHTNTNPASAVEAYRKALHINSDLAAVWKGLGIALGMLDRYKEAEGAFQNAIRLEPDNAGSWNNLGLAYQHLGLTEGAIDAFQRALHFDPEHAGAWFNQGVTLASLDRFTEAVDSFRQALSHRPNDVDIWCELGKAYGSLGRFNDAAKTLRQGLSLHPDHLATRYSLSLVYYFSGDQVSALAEARVLRSYDADMAERLLHVIFSQ